MIRIVMLLSTASLVLSASSPKQITLDQGKLSGKYVTRFGKERVAAYLGVPYALPPVLYRRFQAPDYTVLPSWTGARNVTTFAPDCLQSEPKEDDKRRHEEENTSFIRAPFREHDRLWMALLESQQGARKREYSEDCLYLNVYVPDGLQAETYPVMVWLHGGSFTRGSPNDLNPFQLVSKQKVIFVSVAYRLNIFGFFSTLDQYATGNYGLLDQVAALHWVKYNIAAFGGDPGNVCIFGHDAGAVSVGLHLVSPYSSGLFQKAIAMSGNVLSPKAVTTPQKELKTAEKMAHIFGCILKPSFKLLECLLRVQEHHLLQLADYVTEWKPIVDKELTNVAFLPDLPSRRFKDEHFTPVPVLTGYTNMEDALQFVTDTDTERNLRKYYLIGEKRKVDNYCFTTVQDKISFLYKPILPTTNETTLKKLVVEFYNDRSYGAATYQLAKQVSRYAPVYLYRFDTKPYSGVANEGIPDWVSVPHNFDLISAFGLPCLASPTNNKWDDRDKKVSEAIMKMWSHFAWSPVSSPTNSSPGIQWDAFAIENPKFLIINRQNIMMSSPDNINYRAFEFWTDCFTKVAETGGEVL